MFIVKKVRFKNFRSYGNSFTEVDLTRSQSTVISAPNGHGKSSILMAIEFGLFGKVSNGIPKGDLINSVNNRDCVVEVECSMSGKEIMIRRGLKPAIFEIVVDGNLVNQEASSRDYQTHLEEEVLGFNIGAFRQIVSISGGSYTPFLLLSSGNRRRIVEELLNLTIFSKMNIHHLANIAANREAIQSNESEIIRLKSSLESLKKGLATVNQQEEGYRKTILEGIETSKQRIAAITEEIETSNQKIESLSPQIKKLKKSTQKRLGLLEVKKDIQKKISKLDALVKFFNDNDTCPTCSQSITTEFRESVQTPKAEKKTELDSALTELGKMIAGIESVIDKLQESTKEARDLEMKIHSDNKRISDLKKHISEQEKILNSKSANRQDLEDDIRLTDKNLTVHKKKELELFEDKQYNDVVSAIIKDNGIKSKILTQYIPRMNQEINRYLQILNLNLNFQMDENFNEKILSRFKDEMTYSSFSAGERARIDIAILFTWRELAKLKNSISCNLLFLDEIFDSVLDEEGLESFANLLRHNLPDSNVFIISHRPEIQDKLQSNLRIIKQGNFSNIQ